MRLIDCFTPLISFALHAQANSSDIEPEKLAEQFIDFVKRCRALCDEHGFRENERESGLFAVVAWIDEQRLCDPLLGDQWVHYLLQKTLFNTTNSGDEFYDRFSKIDNENDELRNVYIHCLALGFRGKMYESADVFEDFCQQTFACDSESIGGSLPDPLFPQSYASTDGGSLLQGRSRRVLSSLFFVVLSAGILGGLYLLGERSLGLLYSSLKMVAL